MRNAIARTAFTAIATLAAAVAFAAPTAELKVTGVIKPPACTPNLAAGGVVDYGIIPASSLTAGQNKKLETRQVDLSITCDGPAKMSVKFTDNRASSRVAGITGRATDPYNFGLGAVAGKNVGGYALSFDANSTVDGVAARNIYSGDNGRTWNGGVVYLQHDGQLFSFGNGSNLPVAFKQLNAKINVETTLNKPENLPLSQDVPLDGSTTIEVNYL
ncbi:DUF1120 domain-containing protein [Herbaspirillum sp.]|uniref:DUF1120 domain-containing protein n=1 Tax=Herbaspirillum sp. TaxID=1890675 RepID=UPI001B27A31D|nr:DUF1120 domain-containing protein [Herbaspirillum sp.]MBO9536799.1 DUF1120 domain-containing protein [Herbaspirillum sp.]